MPTNTQLNTPDKIGTASQAQPQYTTQQMANAIRQKYPQVYDGKPDDQLVNAWVQKYPVYKTQLKTEAPKPDPLSSVHVGGSNAENPITSIVNQAKSGMSQIKEGTSEISKGESPIQGGESALKAESGLATVITSPLAPIFRVVNEMIQKAGEGYATLPSVKAFAQTPTAETAMRVAQDLSNAGNVAGTIAGGTKGVENAPEVATKATDLAKSTIEQGKGAIDSARVAMTPKPEDVAVAKEKQTAATNEKAHQAIDTEVRNTAAKYPSVGKILNASETARGTEPVKVLSSYPEGKALPTLVKGKLQVDTPVKFLKDQVSRLSEIKKNLVGTAKDTTTVEDFKQAALDRISKQDWSTAKKAQESAGVQKLLSDLESTYPDGIPSTEMDLLKTEHANESKSYNSKSTFSPDTHAIVGQTAKDIVETQGGEAPIEELNKLISSHYDAIKLLGAMRGKTPHGGALSKMFNNTIGEVTGLGAGMAIGHPFLGAMAGRAGAEAITEIINNHFISNPLKRSLVKNMKGADPEVVGKALEYLKNDKSSTQPVESQSPEASK